MSVGLLFHVFKPSSFDPGCIREKSLFISVFAAVLNDNGVMSSSGAMVTKVTHVLHDISAAEFGPQDDAMTSLTKCMLRTEKISRLAKV